MLAADFKESSLSGVGLHRNAAGRVRSLKLVSFVSLSPGTIKFPMSFSQRWLLDLLDLFIQEVTLTLKDC